MAQIVIETSDEIKQAFEARAKATKAPSGENYESGSALILDFVRGHLLTAEREKHEAAATKEYTKAERRIRRMFDPEDD